MLNETTCPPARLSVDDPDIDWEVAVRGEILLDGVIAKDVIAYDCEAGTLTRSARDRRGNLQINLGKEEIVRETVTGLVTVRWKAPR